MYSAEEDRLREFRMRSITEDNLLGLLSSDIDFGPNIVYFALACPI